MRERFTRWYFRRGWVFDSDGFDCPWYIRPFLFLFSPSIYVHEVMRQFVNGMRDALEGLCTEAANAVAAVNAALREFGESLSKEQEKQPPSTTSDILQTTQQE